MAGRSGGSASVIANIAGSADSSPMNRCQSAVADVVIFPRGRVKLPDRVAPPYRAVTLGRHQQHHVLAGQVAEPVELRGGQPEPAWRRLLPISHDPRHG